MAKLDDEAAARLELPDNIPPGGRGEAEYRRGASYMAAVLRCGYYETQVLDACSLWHGNADTIGDPRMMSWRGLVLDRADAEEKAWARRN